MGAHWAEAKGPGPGPPEPGGGGGQTKLAALEGPSRKGSPSGKPLFGAMSSHPPEGR